MKVIRKAYIHETIRYSAAKRMKDLHVQQQLDGLEMTCKVKGTESLVLRNKHAQRHMKDYTFYYAIIRMSRKGKTV